MDRSSENMYHEAVHVDLSGDIPHAEASSREAGGNGSFVATGRGATNAFQSSSPRDGDDAFGVGGDSAGEDGDQGPSSYGQDQNMYSQYRTDSVFLKGARDLLDGPAQGSSTKRGYRKFETYEN